MVLEPRVREFFRAVSAIKLNFSEKGGHYFVGLHRNKDSLTIRTGVSDLCPRIYTTWAKEPAALFTFNHVRRHHV
jgi:hypothetical protein